MPFKKSNYSFDAQLDKEMQNVPKINISNPIG